MRDTGHFVQVRLTSKPHSKQSILRTNRFEQKVPELLTNIFFCASAKSEHESPKSYNYPTFSQRRTSIPNEQRPTSHINMAQEYVLAK